ncbi:hypothetical protein TL16_g00937 [Triparma laevis f. inornata]|uniref:Carbohydrate esterase 2 N-terminal domain-containing protein n=1 Tax=Triparma laevis f. inornata TaxID=1714386 RepID=A0A9W7DUE7_9STRA|nr:hypothetical protein TL16_g00937 [Triparma laevis f. inornata]
MLSLLSVLSSATSSNVSSSELTISHTHPKINYLGRFLPTPNSTSFAWTHTQISINATGLTKVVAKLSGGKKGSRFVVIIDEEIGEPFIVTSDLDTYALTPKKLSPSIYHTISLLKISEDQTQHNSKGASTFESFRINGDADLVDFNNRETKIHFIGDSDTAGWCSNGSPTSSNNFLKTQNSHITWSSQLSKQLNADLETVTAISGIGVMDWPIQDYIDNTITFDDSSSWDWSRSTPDAVVILIGPNDDSSKTVKFTKAYNELLDVIVERYSDSEPKIINVCGGSINGLDPCSTISTIVDSFNSKRSDNFKAYYTSIKEDTWKTINKRKNGFEGCDEHYNEKGHEALMKDIVDDVKSFMAEGR